MSGMEKNMEINPEITTSSINLHEDVMNLNTKIFTDSVQKEIELESIEAFCDAMKEQANKIKIEVIKVEAEFVLQKEKQTNLLLKHQMLNENTRLVKSMITIKKEIIELLQDKQRLEKARDVQFSKLANMSSKTYQKEIQKKCELLNQTPLAQKWRQCQIEIQKRTINVAILKKKIEDEKARQKLLKSIRKRQAQLVYIKFANLLLDYYEIQKIKKEIKKYEDKLAENKKLDDIAKQTNETESVEQTNEIQQLDDSFSSFELPEIDLSTYGSTDLNFLCDKNANEKNSAPRYDLKNNFMLSSNKEFKMPSLLFNKKDLNNKIITNCQPVSQKNLPEKSAKKVNLPQHPPKTMKENKKIKNLSQKSSQKEDLPQINNLSQEINHLENSFNLNPVQHKRTLETMGAKAPKIAKLSSELLGFNLTGSPQKQKEIPSQMFNLQKKNSEKASGTNFSQISNNKSQEVQSAYFRNQQAENSDEVNTSSEYAASIQNISSQNSDILVSSGISAETRSTTQNNQNPEFVQGNVEGNMYADGNNDNNQIMRYNNSDFDLDRNLLNPYSENESNFDILPFSPASSEVSENQNVENIQTNNINLFGAPKNNEKSGFLFNFAQTSSKISNSAFNMY